MMMMMIKTTAPARTPAKIATGNSSLYIEAPGLTSAVVSRTGPDVEACGCVGVADGEPPLTDKKTCGRDRWGSKEREEKKIDRVQELCESRG